jgi:hypothetical protein
MPYHTIPGSPCEFENDVDCNASETFARGNIGKTQTVEEWKTYSIPDNTGMYWLSAVSGGLYVLLSICGLVAVLKRHSVLLLTYQAALTFAALVRCRTYLHGCLGGPVHGGALLEWRCTCT